MRSKGYNWVDSNRATFESWDVEVGAVESLGYTLIPADVELPVDYAGKEPKVYVSRRSGVDVWNGPRGRRAGEYGYPLYYKIEEEEHQNKMTAIELLNERGELLVKMREELASADREIERLNLMVKMFVAGDLVKYKWRRGILVCGSGMYDHAVVASLNPFILVSEEGDMMWRSTVKVEDFEKVGQAERKVLLNVIDRLVRDKSANEQTYQPISS